MPPDEAGEFLLRLVEEKTGRDLAASDILDVGCGTRFAASIINRGIPVKSYTGVDIDRDLVDFLQGATAGTDNLAFYLWNVKNALYNPGGENITADGRFPVGDRLFDIVCFFSVFTHLTPSDAEAVLKITQKVMKPEARIFLTAFVDSNQEANFVDADPSKPLFKAIFKKSFFETVVDNCGFAIDYFSAPTKLTAYQYVLRKK